MMTDVDVRRSTDEDLAGCVRSLRAVHLADGYPTWWPADPAGWLSPSGCAAAWVAHDHVMGSILGHVCVVGDVDDVDDPMVASLTGVSTDRLVGVSRLFVSPAGRLGHPAGREAWPADLPRPGALVQLEASIR